MPKEVAANSQTSQIPIRRVRGERFAVYYSNGVQVVPTQWDVQLIFEQFVVPAGGAAGAEVIAEQQAAVILSAEHARSLLELLQRQLG